MMDRSDHIDARAAAIDRLARVGRAAMPDVSDLAVGHLGDVSMALDAERMRSYSNRSARSGARRVPRRRLALVGALCAFVALPSLALAGVLPDPVQRAASRVAASVGVDLPAPKAHQDTDPRDARAGDEQGDRSGSSGDGARDGASTSTGDDRRADGEAGHVNGDQPGKPEDGEQRGNRFGQVPEGPDQGKAGQSNGSTAGGAKPARPVKPATSKPDAPKPSTPKPATPKPAAPAPTAPAPTAPTPVEPTPTPPAPSGGAGNSGGNTGGNGNGNAA